jgi:hypothetical protein
MNKAGNMTDPDQTSTNTAHSAVHPRSGEVYIGLTTGPDRHLALNGPPFCEASAISLNADQR